MKCWVEGVGFQSSPWKGAGSVECNVKGNVEGNVKAASKTMSKVTLKAMFKAASNAHEAFVRPLAVGQEFVYIDLGILFPRSNGSNNSHKLPRGCCSTAVPRNIRKRLGWAHPASLRKAKGGGGS